MKINNKEKLWSMFQNLNQDDSLEMKHSIDSGILIIDGLNCFIRAFQSSPAMNTNGDHIGGISSFLKSIGHAIKLLKPSKVIIVFDGVGGSLKRRKIYSGYKNGRRTKINLNRTYSDIGTDILKSSHTELIRVVEYLDVLPITKLAVDYVEADDAIAHLAHTFYKDKNVVIMSTDKDFLQLVNDNITIWSPTKKIIYDCDKIYREYGIYCNNFIFYRILNGDKSDNISGIRGAGLKMILKAFPFLTSDKTSSIDEILNYSINNKSKYKIYSNILDNIDILKRNYELMQLYDTQLQSFSQLRIEEIVEKSNPLLNKIELLKMITRDQMWNQIPNNATWINECFNRLNNVSLKKLEEK
jgi:DNA polymerase-1